MPIYILLLGLEGYENSNYINNSKNKKDGNKALYFF